MDRANRRGGVARKLRGGVLLGRLDDVDEVVRNAALLRLRQLVGADVEPAVDRGRVAVDDLAAVLLGERERQRALAGRRGPENGEDARIGHCRRMTDVHDERAHQKEKTQLLRARHRRAG